MTGLFSVKVNLSVDLTLSIVLFFCQLGALMFVSCFAILPSG